MSPESFWPRRGDTIDRFIVLEQIGEGGLGTVHAAYDPDLDRKVAIKLLRGVPDGDRTQARLFREAQSMARLSHPNVAAVFEVGLAEDRVYIAMEYVPGVNLRDWLTRRRRPQREILRIFIAAGRGLAAAHAAGVVHRDFKPANVMVGDDGRPRVVDFGLARAPTGTSMRSAADSGHAPAFDITRTGVVVGTPAYSAPEQKLGQAVDARSDQFSFCVALCEALSGVHPFAGSTAEEISAAIIEGHRTSPPAGGVPTWIRPILDRGMQSARGERFPDMQALLQALSRDPKTRSRRVLAGLVVASLLGVTALGSHLASQPPTLCRDARDHMAGIWDAEARARLRSAFVAVDRPHANETIRRIEARLDAWTEDWIAQHTAACEATHFLGTQSEQVLDLRMACLRRKLGSLEALVAVLTEQPDANTLAKAIPAVAALGGVAFCADVEALQQEVLPPEDPETRAAVDRFRARLERGRQHDELGKHGQAAAINAEVEAPIGTLGYPPLSAELALRKGENQSLLGNYDAAEESLDEALRIGLRLHQRDLALRAAQELTYVVGSRMARHEAGLAYARVAMGLSNGLGDEREARSWGNYGDVLWSQGEYDRGEAEHRRAIALWEKALGTEHPEVATARHRLGYDLIYQSRHHEAEIELRRALAIRERAFGADHPSVASTQVALGIALLHQGKYREAESQHRRAVAAIETSLGRDHPNAATARGRLGVFFYNQGRLQEAESEYRRALRIREMALGPNHPDTLIVRSNVGLVLVEQGRYREAEAEYQRVLASWAEAPDPEHPDVAWPLSGLGDLYRETERWESAERLYERTLSICARASCTANPRANAEFGLARILWRRVGDRGRALQLAEQAREGYAKDHLTEEVAKVDHWLARRRPLLPQQDDGAP